MTVFTARRLSLFAASLLPSAAAAQPAPDQAAAVPVAADYRQDSNWLCRPGRKDACTVDQTATVVPANGRLSREVFAPAKAAPVDCFYVYPTVSLDRTPNSDLIEGDEERRVVEQQLARFAGQCRLFAPLYRQVTLTALRSTMTGAPPAGVSRELGYSDVKAAWNDYLARDNKGRGVVLIGHSQGAGVLRRLLAEEVDGQPVQGRLVSALLIGTAVATPQGADVGGDFESIPLCRAANQTGCVVSYATFRNDSPPPANSRFGRVPSAGQAAACVNPAALKGGEAPLDAYLAAGSRAVVSSAAAPGPWTTAAQPITTPFVKVPGLLTGRCVSDATGSYLAVTVKADPKDPRTDAIVGDVMSNGAVLKDWGLHLIDMNVAMGDLVKLVGEQSRAFRAKATRAKPGRSRRG